MPSTLFLSQYGYLVFSNKIFHVWARKVYRVVQFQFYNVYINGDSSGQEHITKSMSVLPMVQAKPDIVTNNNIVGRHLHVALITQYVVYCNLILIIECPPNFACLAGYRVSYALLFWVIVYKRLHCFHAIAAKFPTTKY